MEQFDVRTVNLVREKASDPVSYTSSCQAIPPHSHFQVDEINIDNFLAPFLVSPVQMSHSDLSILLALFTSATFLSVFYNLKLITDPCEVPRGLCTTEKFTIILSKVRTKSVSVYFFSSWGSTSVEAGNTTAAFTSPK